MRLKDIMTADLIFVSSSATLQEAAQLMESHNVGMLPVTDDHRLVGTITDRDITVRAVAQGDDPRTTRVSEAMTPGVVYCYETDDVAHAAQTMETQQVRRLIVANTADEPVGIVSITDLAKGLTDVRLLGEVLSSVSRPYH